MKVFISYGNDLDQITALRLQALATANGLAVYVPPVYTRSHTAPFIDTDVAVKLTEADVVLGVIRGGMSGAFQAELNQATQLKKNMVVMSDPAFAGLLRPLFSANVVFIDPSAPEQSEIEIVGHLKAIDASQQSAKMALLALGTLALGLFILAPAKQN